MIKTLPQLAAILILFTFGSCKKNSDDPTTPTTTTSGTTGYISTEINGKLTTLYGDLRANRTTDGLGYSIYGAQEFPVDGVKSITISIALENSGSTFDINTLKGIHNSGNKISKSFGDLLIFYEVFSSATRTDYTWVAKENCTVEITSTTSPWIEGTFSANNDMQPQGSASGTVSLKKGSFKIKYSN